MTVLKLIPEVCMHNAVPTKTPSVIYYIANAIQGVVKKRKKEEIIYPHMRQLILRI